VKLRYADGRVRDVLLGGIFRRGFDSHHRGLAHGALAEVSSATGRRDYELDLGDASSKGSAASEPGPLYEGELAWLAWPRGTLGRDGSAGATYPGPGHRG